MTSSDVRAVLLAPAEGDPLKLLAGGPCGARPPIATQWECQWGHPYDWCASGPTEGEVPCAHPDHPDHPTAPKPLGVFRRHRALVLAWDGELVDEGIDRACRHSPKRYQDGGITTQVVRLLMDGRRRPGRSLTALGSVVLLDADGRRLSRLLLAAP